jgi:hypothetical protein
MLDRALFTLADLLDVLDRIRPGLVRYPGLDAAAFALRVRAFMEQRHG